MEFHEFAPPLLSEIQKSQNLAHFGAWVVLEIQKPDFSLRNHDLRMVAERHTVRGVKETLGVTVQ